MKETRFFRGAPRSGKYSCYFWTNTRLLMP